MRCHEGHRQGEKMKRQDCDVPPKTYQYDCKGTSIKIKGAAGTSDEYWLLPMYDQQFLGFFTCLGAEWPGRSSL